MPMLILDLKEGVRHMQEDKYFKNATPNTIPTLPEEESKAPTDAISETVEKMVDKIQDTFDGEDEKKED
jgi:hypothetical protein